MFPEYPVITQLQKKFISSYDPKEFYIISVQHLLETTGSMFESFISTGFMPDNIFLTGKIYSTHEATQQKLKSLGINLIESSIPNELGVYAESLEKDVCKMWQLLSMQLKPESKIIILDDGGYTLKNVPDSILENHSVFGIEQTTSGIRMQSAFGKFPVIHLAASAAKVIIEPPIVSEAVKIQLGKIIEELHPEKIGVVGYGNIGKAVAKDFKDKYNILVYDNKNELQGDVLEGVTYLKSLDDLYKQSNVIIGATGQDISDLNWLTNSTDDKTLISVSSGDIEFNNLLRQCKSYLTEDLKNPLQILNLKTVQGHSLKILRGGMVANFTGTPDSSPGHIIQVTRGLLFSAVAQIIRDNAKLKMTSGAVMLDPAFQSEVVQFWFQDQPQRHSDYSEEVLNGFKNIEWIKKHSAGSFIN